MIADQVEATSRTMAGAPEADLREMVGATVERLRTAGQFDDTPLTLRDLATVRETLVQMLVGLHHRRIAYPKAASPPAAALPAWTVPTGPAPVPEPRSQR
jgi:membrane-associated HD superfamily phosphohydrolase